jgi:hypothetical protein
MRGEDIRSQALKNYEVVKNIWKVVDQGLEIIKQKDREIKKQMH